MTVFDKVREIIVDDLSVDPGLVTADAILEGENLYASLDVVECIMRCEEEFEIEISDEDAQATENTVGGSVRVIENKLQGRPLWPGFLLR